jgi:multidrug efflux pump subunit AcrB/predicted flap endonuclease-1-like 5' DNA nuclease
VSNVEKNRSGSEEQVSLGIAGAMTKGSVHSPLTPLLLFACLAIGLLGLLITPRQEDPQISVPMVDIFVQYPGASSDQVSSLAIDPLERMMSEIHGVKHVYSAAQRGMGMVTVQFDVGERMEPSLVKLYDKLASNLDKMPPGVPQPLVKPKGVDDVPVVTLTLWSDNVDDASLRLVALEATQRLKEVRDTSQSFIVGGRSEEIRIEVLPERLKGFGIGVQQVAGVIRSANTRRDVGQVEAGGTSLNVYAGEFLKHASDVQSLIVGVHRGSPVYVRDVATITEGPGEAASSVQYFTGPAHKDGPKANGAPAVTIAIAKKAGTNGVTVANDILAKVETLKGQVIPDNVNIAITRNYGETADDKVTELIVKLFVATGAVTVLVFLALGLRPAIVVLVVIPVVILITVFSAWVLDYTIDRVSLFALIFSIGILVDDAIVVVENIYRRWLMKGDIDTDTTIDAVREVGNPTILATFTVVAALLPMGFVSGMMGPYMRPIPVLGSVAMMFSLFAAFIFTPWLAQRIPPSIDQLHKMEQKEHRQVQWLDSMFRRLLGPLIDHPGRARLFRLGIWGAFLLSCVLFYTTSVAVKMLPLDNKPEFNVVVNMPEGTALPVTANAVLRLAEKALTLPEVTAVQTYSGTASPFNFNGLVRHYYMRQQPWEGDIQIQLLHKSKRKRSSHEIAVQTREMLTPLAKELGAKIQVVEMPPGPPVLQTLVAEIYGPDANTRRQVARDLTKIFEKAEGVVDVDNYLQDDYQVWTFVADRKKAEHRNITVGEIAEQLSMVMGGYKLGDAKLGHELEPRYLVMQAPLEVRGQMTRVGDLPITTKEGVQIPLSELGSFQVQKQDPIVFHKDLRPLEYVTGEVAGRLAAPVYGMIEISKLLKDYKAPDGVTLSGTLVGPPAEGMKSGFEWTGEWTVTYETFRDMGLAFAAAMVLIYMLVVWEFGNFRLPGIIMAPIPLTLIGIIPGHWLLGAEFTATSMIGFIALGGIIVRNSILLVDFSKHAIQEGMDIREAVILSARTRTRPIVITALALVAGSSVIITDPIFNGMAIALLFGSLVSTVLTLFVIPLACVRARRGAWESRAQASKTPAETAAGVALAEPATAHHGATAALPAAQPAPAAIAADKGPSLLSRLGGILTMAFYVLRMPFILIGDWLKSAIERLVGPKVAGMFGGLGGALGVLWMVLRDGTRALLGRTRSKTAQVAGGGSGGSAPSSPPTSSAPVAPGAAPAAAAAAPASPLAAVTTAIAGPPAATTQPGRANGDDSAAATAVATVEHVAAVSVPAVTDQAGDDLQLINGIGPAIERQLRAHGVTRFEQIANWSGADVERIDELLSFRGRVVRENWVGQAKKLAKAATTGAGTHSARARKPIARHPAGRKPGE